MSTVNRPSPWDIHVHDESLYARIRRQKNLGLGESYMDGWWDCEHLDELICRLLNSGIEEKVRADLRYLMRFAPALVFNLQSKGRARIIAERHYDLDNDLFFSFLDPYNQYSCGYFEGTDDLSQAQHNKLALICRKLNLTAGIMYWISAADGADCPDILPNAWGCGNRREHLTGTASLCPDFCTELPVRFQDCDYRAIDGRFDKIVSVGMFEHVGNKNYRTFIRVVHRCLNDNGILLLHTIGSNPSQTSCDPGSTATYSPTACCRAPHKSRKPLRGFLSSKTGITSDTTMTRP